MRIDREGRETECLIHHDARRLVSHPRQSLQFFKSRGNATAVLLAEDACGVGAAEKSAGVTIFTRASVQRAESTTATRSVNGS